MPSGDTSALRFKDGNSFPDALYIRRNLCCCSTAGEPRCTVKYMLRLLPVYCGNWYMSSLLLFRPPVSLIPFSSLLLGGGRRRRRRRRRRRSHDEWVGNGWWETSRKNKREEKVRISPLISKRNLSHFINSSDWSFTNFFILLYFIWGILSL